MDCGELLAAHSLSQLSWNDSLQVNDIHGATQGGDTWEVAAGARQPCRELQLELFTCG